MEKEVLICKSCGTTIGVSMQLDPFEYDINGDDTLYALCDNCAEESAMDI